MGALEELPHDRMARAVVEQFVDVRRANEFAPGSSDRIAARPYRQLRQSFQDWPFLHMGREFGLVGELKEVVRSQLAVQFALLDEVRPLGDDEAFEHILNG